MAGEKLAIEGGPKAVTTARGTQRRFGTTEREALLQALENENLFRYLREDESQVRALERRFGELIGAPHCLAVSSGTAALVCGLVGLGIGPGDEVILPGYTYISSAAAIINVRAVPVITEVDDTLTLDPADVERKITPSTRAIMPVHMRGIPSQMAELIEIARRHNLLLIEDTAQACGGSYRGKRLGTWGDAGCFSLQHYKIITTGEGGAVVTADPKIFGRATMYHDAGRPYWEGYEGEVIPGVNYRMSELAGAIGRAQVEQLDAILARTRQAKQRILRGIQGIPGVQLQRVPDPEGDCGIVLIMFLPDAEEAKRFSTALKAEGCAAGTMYSGEFPDRHIYAYWDHILEKRGYNERDNPWTHPYYKGNVQYSKDMCPQTLDYLGRAVATSIPDYLTDAEADERAAAIRKVAEAYYGA
jgi:8-amino-3,8-dideoxy-alpha-D-manno-octulosonate transaminase